MAMARIPFILLALSRYTAFTTVTEVPVCSDPINSIWSSIWALDIQGKIQWNAVCPGKQYFPIPRP